MNGKGGSVIDYVFGDKEVRNSIDKMMIGDRMDSDHQRLEVQTEREERDREELKGRKELGLGGGMKRRRKCLSKKWADQC